MAEASKEIIRAAKKGDLAKLKGLLATDWGLVHANDTDGSIPGLLHPELELANA